MIALTKNIFAFSMLLALSTPTLAALVTYDFTNNAACGNFNANTETCTVDGVVMTITSTGGKMNNNGNGIGINTNPAAGSIGAGEALLFDFSPSWAALLSGIIFEKNNSGRAAGPGSFDVLVDGVLSDTVTWTAGTGNVKVPVTFAGSSYGQTIKILGTRGAFRVSELTFNVPEPSTFALFALGLLASGLAYRKRH